MIDSFDWNGVQQKLFINSHFNFLQYSSFFKIAIRQEKAGFTIEGLASMMNEKRKREQLTVRIS